MKYRIKNPNLRRAFESLFGKDLMLDFDLELSQAIAEISLRVPGKSMHPYTAEIKLEPIPEIIDGWHPFPADKPDKVDRYLVAYDCDGEKEVDAMFWNGEYFYPANDDVVAWREFPKYW